MKLKSEKGQAMVEFALLLPLFIVLTLGIMEIGWRTYQESIFKYCYVHASWDLTEQDIDGYIDDMDDENSDREYNEARIVAAIEKAMRQNNFWGLNMGNVTVENVSAKCYNTDENFSVPSWDGTPVDGISRTRWMELEADLTYQVPVLSIAGKIIFGTPINEIEGKIDCKRIVGAAHRTE